MYSLLLSVLGNEFIISLVEHSIKLKKKNICVIKIYFVKRCQFNTIFHNFFVIRKKVLSLAVSATGAGKLEEISQAFVEVIIKNCYHQLLSIISPIIINHYQQLGNTSLKKCFLSGIARFTSPPHPPPPNLGNMYHFFGRQKQRFNA